MKVFQSKYSKYLTGNLLTLQPSYGIGHFDVENVIIVDHLRLIYRAFILCYFWRLSASNCYLLLFMMICQQFFTFLEGDLLNSSK